MRSRGPIAASRWGTVPTVRRCWSYTTSKKPNDILTLSLWETPGIVAEMFNFRAVHNGPSCKDVTHGGAKKKGKVHM